VRKAKILFNQCRQLPHYYKYLQRTARQKKRLSVSYKRDKPKQVGRARSFAIFVLLKFMDKPYFAHPTAVIDEGCEIGEGTKIWHFSHVMPKCKIGRNCNLGQNVVVSPEVVLGENVKVQNNVSIYTGVTCEDDVFLGPSMVFTNVINPRSAVVRKLQYAATRVGKGATIGANATIVCGYDIGKYAFIGAGAVVTKPVPAYALVVGNPSKQIGWMSEFGHRLEFDKEGKAICKESGQQYVLNNNSVSRVS
jgi:UDP-2-acetamido-3-amino-2,3-dideoxy-glucuronate N-acetyltransferase